MSNPRLKKVAQMSVVVLAAGFGLLCLGAYATASTAYKDPRKR